MSSQASAPFGVPIYGASAKGSACRLTRVCRATKRGADPPRAAIPPTSCFGCAALMCVGAERAHGGRVQRHPHRGKGFEPLEDKARRMLKVRYGMQGTDRHLPCAEQEPAWARTEIHVSVWWHVAPTLASCKSPKRPLEMKVFPQACKLRITDLEQSSRLAKVSQHTEPVRV